jgi:hypothetical protein
MDFDLATTTRATTNALPLIEVGTATAIATSTTSMTTRGYLTPHLAIAMTATRGNSDADLAIPDLPNRMSAGVIHATTLAGRSVNVTSGRATPIRARCSRAT